MANITPICKFCNKILQNSRFANDDMQQDRCQRNTFKQFSKSSFQIKTRVKDAGIEEMFRKNVQQGFF